MFRRLLVVGIGGTLSMVVLALVSLRVAALFGAGTQLDAYLVGVSGPAILSSLTGAVVTSFLTPRLSLLGPAAAARRAGEWALLGFVLSASVAVGIALLSPLVIAVLAPGLSSHAADVASGVLRIYALSLPATIAATVYAAYGFAYGRVWVSGAAASVFGVTWLALLLVPTFARSGSGVAAACVIASQLQLLAAFLACGFSSTRPWPVPRWRLPARPRTAIAGVSGVMTTAAIGKVNLLLDPMLGSLAGLGAVSKLAFATRLTLLIVVVCGQGPALALLGGRRSSASSENPLARAGFGVTLLISAGAATGVAITFEPVARLILAHGQFSEADASQIGRLVQAYAPFTVVTATAWSLESILYSMGSTWRITILNVPGLVANIVLSAGLLPLMGIVARPVGATVGAAIYLVALANEVRGAPGGFDVAQAVPARAVALTVVKVSAICAGGAACEAVTSLPAGAWALASLAGTGIVVLRAARTWLAEHEPSSSDPGIPLDPGDVREGIAPEPAR